MDRGEVQHLVVCGAVSEPLVDVHARVGAARLDGLDDRLAVALAPLDDHVPVFSRIDDVQRIEGRPVGGGEVESGVDRRSPGLVVVGDDEHALEERRLRGRVGALRCGRVVVRRVGGIRVRGHGCTRPACGP